MRSCGIRPRTIIQHRLKIYMLDLNVKVAGLKLEQHIPWADFNLFRNLSFDYAESKLHTGQGSCLRSFNKVTYDLGVVQSQTTPLNYISLRLSGVLHCMKCVGGILILLMEAHFANTLRVCWETEQAIQAQGKEHWIIIHTPKRLNDDSIGNWCGGFLWPFLITWITFNPSMDE